MCLFINYFCISSVALKQHRAVSVYIGTFQLVASWHTPLIRSTHIVLFYSSSIYNPDLSLLSSNTVKA